MKENTAPIGKYGVENPTRNNTKIGKEIDRMLRVKPPGVKKKNPYPIIRTRKKDATITRATKLYRTTATVFIEGFDGDDPVFQTFILPPKGRHLY